MKVMLYELRPGAIFVTEDGVYAVKSEYRYNNTNPQFQCILLESGEYAHFPAGNKTLVEEVELTKIQEENEKVVSNALAEFNEAWRACEAAAYSHSSEQFRLCMKRLDAVDRWFKQRDIRVYYDQNKAEHFLSGSE